MSVAAIRPPAAIYREEQFFAWWLYVLLAVMVAVGWCSFAWNQAAGPPQGVAARGPALELPLAFAVGLVLPPALVLGVLRMTTEVGPASCRVWFGFIPTYRRAIALDEVKRVEIVTYRAFREHYFWGVHTTRDGERVLTARGDRGVRLHLSDGSRVLIGSQRAEELAAALESAMRPVG